MVNFKLTTGWGDICCSVTKSYLTLCHPWTAACQASLSFTIYRSLLKLMSTESVMSSSHLTLCCPLLLLPSIFPSTRVFPLNQSFAAGGQMYWNFSFIISPSDEHSGLISFRSHWFDLLAVQGTLKSLLKHHSSKASVLWCLSFFMVQLSHPYITGKRSLSIWTFVSKVMSQLCNTLFRFVIAFLQRSRCLLISCL